MRSEKYLRNLMQNIIKTKKSENSIQRTSLMIYETADIRTYEHLTPSSTHSVIRARPKQGCEMDVITKMQEKPFGVGRESTTITRNFFPWLTAAFIMLIISLELI